MLTVIAVPLVESARVPSPGRVGRTLCRLAIVEDVAMAVLVPLLTSVRSSFRSVCIATSLLATLLALAHVAYVAVVRPFGRRLDSFFAIAAGLLLLVVAGFSAAAIHRPQLAAVGDTAFTAVAFLFFVQAFVALAHLVIRSVQRSRQAKATGEGEPDALYSAAPLLDLPSGNHHQYGHSADQKTARRASGECHTRDDVFGGKDPQEGMVDGTITNPLQQHHRQPAV